MENLSVLKTLVARRGDSLASRLEVHTARIPFHGCWEWVGPITGDGYGALKNRGKMVGAHRASWAINRGPVPSGLCVLHQCDNPLCVNPAHLFLGTHGDNSRDRCAKLRGAFGERNGNAFLSEGDVRSIRSECASGIPQRNLAKKHRVTQSAISKIVLGKTWRHLDRTT